MAKKVTKRYKDKKVLISGINGFIGQNLAGLLNEQGAKVGGLPRDILVIPTLLDEYLKDIQPDYVFHLAAYGNHYHQKDYDETFMSNVMKTYTLARICAANYVSGFFNFSTSSVYGNSSNVMSEDNLPNPKTIYASTKLCGEHIVNAVGRDNDMPIINIRPFSVYGEGEDENRFIPKIIETLVKETSMNLDPTPVHDWIYIEDFIQGIFTIVDNIDSLKGQVVNIGTGNQTTNEDIVRILQGIHGTNDDSLFIKSDTKLRDYDVDSMWKADTSKLSSYNFTPKHTLYDGLKKTYDYYKPYFEDELPKREKTLKDAFEESLAMEGIEFKPL